MNNQAKMIIITSNEDLIEQISLNKSENTRIIDLDQNNPNSSMMMKDNHNSIDLNLIAQFSEFVCIFYLNQIF
jgi:hypothetical protein